MLARFLASPLTIALLCVTAAAAEREPDMCLVPPGAQPSLPAKLLEGQGVTHMPVTTRSQEAQAFFNQGISQLHSFWALEDERSFLQAATLDPSMAMAHWGIAVAAAGEHRPGFQLLRNAADGARQASIVSAKPADGQIARTINGAAIDGKIRSREAIEKAMSMRKQVTRREQLYIEAQWARTHSATKDSDGDYVKGLRKIVAAYPDDEEAKSFLGLTLLYGYEQPSKQPRPGTLEGVRLLEDVIAKNDNNFGAHHYLIHAYEGSKTPEKAWHACERYPQLVTNIPHALHMPGHIYAQSDRIDAAIKSFTEAGANELYYLNADLLYPNGHHGHNIHFLIHSLNLDGRYADSMLQVQALLSFRETPRERAGQTQRTPWRQGYFTLVKTLVRFERWNDILDGRTIPTYDKPEQRAWRAWAIGLAQSATGKPEQANESLEALRAATVEMKTPPPPLEAAMLELRGVIEARAGNRERGWELLRMAADRESSMIYTEPPPYPRPVVEGWGHVAFELGDFAAADRIYAEALQIEPGGGRAYIGRARSLAALGKVQESADMLAKARVAWNNADVPIPDMATLRLVKSASR